MRYGYWLPVFGGWLRNVEQENMEASWRYVKQLAQRSEQLGFDLTLVAELNLNDIKGVEAPSLDAWSTAAALAAVTEKLELMVAVRPTFHLPALLAKQAANIEQLTADVDGLKDSIAAMRDEMREGFDNLIIANEVTRDLAERIGKLVLSNSQRLTKLEQGE